MSEPKWTYDDTGIHVTDEDGSLLAEILFADIGDGTYNITHTFVSDRLRGMGMASRLVEAAVEAIKEKGGRPAATCSYARAWLEKNKTKL